jgi:hypothetical protein
MELKNKFAIGCLVQWYEIEMIGEYLRSVKNALDVVDNRENVIVDLYLNCNESLESVDETQITISDIKEKFKSLLEEVFDYDVDATVGHHHNLRFEINHRSDLIYTVADYRRDFNDKYCTEVDVLMWGESDALIPRQTFQVLDHLHSSVKDQTPKYVAFFATCKMWDQTWEVLEHPEFTDKPFVDMSTVDTERWWSLRYNMSIDEMNSFNDKVEDLDVQQTNNLKFNGCGLVFSSEVVKSGVNIPRGSFFIHEDTAFMQVLQRMFGNSIIQYIFKNILLVHNRKHTKKRRYILGEEGINPGDVGPARDRHEWYKKASQMSEFNTYNLFNQKKLYKWEDVFNDKN